MFDPSEKILNGPGDVLLLGDYAVAPLSDLLGRYGMELSLVAAGTDIPGSFWGGSEAGLIANGLYVRADTPLHSALHEACHYICMDGGRRRALHTDAGGGYDEEDAVCYLQILLASELPGFGRERMLSDMDSWGYSFRLGSAGRWFAEDAENALAWLLRHGLVDEQARPSWRLRS